MGANELLRHLKALPVRERNKFVRAVLSLKDAAVPRPKKPAKSVTWPDVEARAKKICGDRVLPNMVLLEREESPY